MLLHLYRFLLLSALSSLWIKGSEARHLSEGGHGEDPPESLASNRGRRRREGGSLEQELDGQVGTGVRIRRRRRDDRRPPADSSPLLLQHDTQGSRLQHLTAEWEEAEHFRADAGKYSDNDKFTPEMDAAQTTVSQTAGSSPTELKHNRKATAQSESHLSPQHAQPPKLPNKTALELKTTVEMHQDGEDSLPSPFSPQIQHPLNTATAQEDEHAKAPETTNTVTNNEDDTMEDAKMDTVDDNSFYDTLSQTHHGNMNRQETNLATDEKKSPTVTEAGAVNTMVPDTAVYIPFTERLSSPKSEVKLEHTKQVGQKQGQNERAAGKRLRRQSGDDFDSDDDGEEDFDDAEGQNEDDADDTDTNYKLDPEGKEADADAQLAELMKEDVPIPTGGKGMQIMTARDQREIDQMSHLIADLVMNNHRNSLSLGSQLTIVGNDPDSEADEEEEYEHARKGRHPRHTSSPNSERNINKNANEMTDENDGDSLDTKVDTEDYIAEDRGSKNSMFFQDGPTRNDEPSDEDDHHNLQFSSQRNLAQHIQDFDDDSGMGYDKGKLIIKNYEDKKYRSFGIDDGGLSKEIGQEIIRSAGIVAAIRRLKDQLLNAYKQGTTSIPDIRGKKPENNGSSVGLNTPEIDPLAIIVHDMKSFTLRNKDQIQDKQTDMERKMLNVMKAVKNKTSKHNTLTKAMPFSHLNDSTKGNKSDSHNADRISIDQQKSENNREFNKRNKTMKTKPLLRNNEKNNDYQLYAELSTGQIADKEQKAPESIKSLNLTDTSDADNSQGNTNNERKDYKDISNTLHKVKEIKMSDRKHNRNSESIRTFENKHISELRTEVNKTGAMMAKEQKSENHPREAMGYDDSYRLTPMLADHVTDFNYQSLNPTTKSKVRPQFIDFVDKASHIKEDTARTHVHPSTEPINENAYLLNFGTNDTNYTNSASKYRDYNYERKSNTINLQTHTPSYQKISSNYKFPIKMQNVVIGQYNPKQNTESKASEIEKDTKADQEDITLRNKENDKNQPNPIKIKESTFEQTYDTQSPGSRIINTHIKSKQGTKPKILIPVNRRKYYFDKQDTDKTKEYKQNAEMEMQNISMYSRKDQQHRMLKRNTRRKRKQHIQKENLRKNNPQKSGTKSDEGQDKLTNDELQHTLSNIKEQIASLEKSLSQKTGKLDGQDGKELDESKPGEKVNEEENIMETELKQTTQIEKKKKKSRHTKPKKDGVFSDKPRQRHNFSKTKLKQSKKVKPKQKNESQRLRDKLKQIKHEGTEYAALSKPTKGKQDHDSYHKHAHKLVGIKKKSKRIRAKHKNKNQLRPRKNGKDASDKDKETVTMEETIVKKEGHHKNDDKNQDSSAAESGLFKDDDNTDHYRPEEQNEPGPNKKAAPDKDGELVDEKKIITKETPHGTEKITLVREKGSKLDEDVGKREEENDDNNNEPRGTEESEENQGDAESDQNIAELGHKKKATPRGNRKSTSNKDEEGEITVDEKRIIKGIDVADRDPILDDIVDKIEKIQVTNNVKEKNQDLAAVAESERYPEDENADDEVVEEKIVTKKKPHATTKIKTIVERDPETDDLVKKRQIKTVDKFYNQDGTEESGPSSDDDDDSD